MKSDFREKWRKRHKGGNQTKEDGSGVARIVCYDHVSGGSSALSLGSLVMACMSHFLASAFSVTCNCLLVDSSPALAPVILDSKPILSSKRISKLSPLDLDQEVLFLCPHELAQQKLFLTPVFQDWVSTVFPVLLLLTPLSGIKLSLCTF